MVDNFMAKPCVKSWSNTRVLPDQMQINIHGLYIPPENINPF